MKLSARGILAGCWGGLCLMIAGAPLLIKSSPVAGIWLYSLFAPLCHQKPSRSFMIDHFPLAVCQRCSGIYLGLFLGTLLAPYLCLPARARRICLPLAALPLALDALLPHTGLWYGTPISRFLTGMLCGGITAPLLVEALTELIVIYSSFKDKTKCNALTIAWRRLRRG